MEVNRFEHDGTEYKVIETDYGFEVEAVPLPTSEAMSRWAEDHPLVDDINETGYGREDYVTYLSSLPDAQASPGSTNIGTCRTDAEKDHLRASGISVSIDWFEQANKGDDHEFVAGIVVERDD